MPNYCNNYGTLTAKNEKAKELFRTMLAEADKIRSDEKNFCEFFIPQPDWENLIDVPEGYRLTSGSWNNERVWLSPPDNSGLPSIKLTDEQKEILEKAGRGWLGSYDFCSNVWGTKWGLFDVYEFGGTEDEITFGGTTAWCPFTNLFRTFCSQQEELPAEEQIIFDVVYDYDERGCDFAGRQTIEWCEQPDGSWDGYDNIQDYEWEIGLETFEDHGTLPCEEDYFLERCDYAAYLGTDWDQQKTGDLLMFDYEDEKFTGIILPDRKVVHIAGVGEVRVYVSGTEWCVEEF
tara:strand:+ start:820 stop:1689 length:870 start_codon:yes stop_codon:yes gene_type:complete